MIQDLGPNSTLYYLSDTAGVVVGAPQITERSNPEGGVAFAVKVDVRFVARESETDAWQEVESLPADEALDPKKVAKKP